MNVDHQTRRHTRMPWGKHKGIFIKDLPDSYINWVVLNYKDQAFASWIAEEIIYRNPKLVRAKK